MGADVAANPDAFTDLEDHAYCTGCMGCVGVMGYVHIPAVFDETSLSCETEHPIKKSAFMRDSFGPVHDLGCTAL